MLCFAEVPEAQSAFMLCFAEVPAAQLAFALCFAEVPEAQLAFALCFGEVCAPKGGIKSPMSAAGDRGPLSCKTPLNSGPGVIAPKNENPA